MKKVFLIAAMALFGFGVQAQDEVSGGQTDMGSWLIEANTGFGAAAASNTSFSLNSIDGDTSWSIGAEGGYFVADDLAVKVGLGYSDTTIGLLDYSSFNYKIGAKYYISSMIPVQVDYAGASIKDADENPSYIGLQGGYAIFLGQNVSIEPGLRYNVALNDFYEDRLQFNVGFALHF
ncbi:hypothetical protein Celal_2865 [Cellulophaga algicola DSM 14237]|uniref:Outer membrane protein beta-barrel domain-containing protein n=1 Tax=Cellulophaga algicola (strain DSM 14237 / IC166 / ACAM 630) TaxID=688270 RepID=E6XDK1_CELAD|nr:MULTISPECIES: hypothetical protein [Cellulophaga]ADV50143.1 hypothetical protein Celal_2865 [Cellulophaga algicola DSM 14237]